MTKVEDITSVCITDGMKVIKKIFVDSNYSRLQEKIKKPFLTKEQIQFGIERFRNLDITRLKANGGL